MKKLLPLVAAVLLGNLCTIVAAAQSTAKSITIRGNVTNTSNKEPIPAVSVIIKGSSEGTYTDDKGHFVLITNQKPPYTLEFSSMGYEQKSVVVNNQFNNIQVSLGEVVSLAEGVVISATRTPSRILESPVSIERVTSANIKNAPAANYYDVVRNLKGVDVVYSSLTYAHPTTRGFATSGNVRFTQIVNGMDNQAPGLNFSVGSIIGLTELDVDNMELLPGASSALYGPGGINGTMLINGKNPFKYQGLSFQVKTGLMHVDDDYRGESPYHNWSVRWAQQVSSKFAYKIGSELIQAKDWLARDYRNYKRLGTAGSIINGTRDTDPNYDGVNVYGDEVSINLRSRVLDVIGQQAPFLSGFINTLPANIPVSRTGYTEAEVTNPNTVNLKLSGSLNYKLTNDIEASLSGYWGTGNTIYTGSQRYSLKDLRMGQYKLELAAKNWFVRAYTTQENSGESHNLTFTTVRFNNAWKSDNDWFGTYGQTYLGAKMQGMNDFTAHAAARAAADKGRPAPGSSKFNSMLQQVRSQPIPVGGKFLDKSDLWMTEGQYNLTDLLGKYAEVLVGGSWKQYVLNSQGTLFADKVGQPIRINEYGGYVQIARQVVKDYLKITASGRYDKNENFKARFTPRVTALITPAKDHNFRLSFQTAYRFPTTQMQWIDLDVISGLLIGGNKFIWDKYNMTNNPVYLVTDLQQGKNTVLNYPNIKPESVSSYEAGYKALVGNNKKLLVDAYVYYSQYKDFLSRVDVAQDTSNDNRPINLNDSKSYRGFSVPVNAPGKVNAIGWGIGIDYLLPNNFSVAANISSDVLNNVPVGFRANFNSPKYRTNLTVSNRGFGKENRFGANVTWRWQKSFFYDWDFISDKIGDINTVDAQISYRIPAQKVTLKLGGNNILNQYYVTAAGNPSIGGLYYFSVGYNL